MKDIIEGNKLIAEFMGYQILHRKFQYRNFNSSNESYFADDEGDIVCDENGHEVNLYPDGDPLEDLSELPFDSSWDWLMPVVDKIEMTSWNISSTRRYLHKPEAFHGNPFRTGDIFISYDEREEFRGWFWQAGFSDLPSITIKESDERASSRIEATWLAVVEFIKWYNKQKENESK